MGFNKSFFSNARRLVILPFVIIILFYKYIISPAIPARCRYYPTCSEYSLIALKNHGLIKGLFLSTHRILRCNPLSKRDYHDPVPEKNHKV